MKKHQFHDKVFIAETKIDFTKSAWEEYRDIAATILLPILGVWALIESNTWTYDGAMDELAETWASKFDASVRFKIIYEIGKTYQEMVVDCEKQNSFCT